MFRNGFLVNGIDYVAAFLIVSERCQDRAIRIACLDRHIMVGCFGCHLFDMLKGRDGGVGVEVAVFVCNIQPCFHLFASLQLFARLFLLLNLRYLAVLIDIETVELPDKIFSTKSGCPVKEVEPPSRRSTGISKRRGLS